MKRLLAGLITIVALSVAVLAQSSYLSQHQLARDPDFLKKVEIAAVNACIAIGAEADTTPNHTKRAAYAVNVCNSPESYARVPAAGANSTTLATGATIDFGTRVTGAARETTAGQAIDGRLNGMGRGHNNYGWAVSESPRHIAVAVKPVAGGPPPSCANFIALLGVGCR